MDHSEVKHLPKVDHTPAELDEASRQLLAAAALLEQPGMWGQVCRDGRGVEGLHCAYTAICGNDTRESTRRLRASVGGDIFSWNDTPGRTKDEVVAKLRAVALGL